MNKSSLPFFVLLAASLARPTYAATPSFAEKPFDLHLFAPFLEPGVGGKPAQAGDEVLAGPATWTAPAAGRLNAIFWRIRTFVTFATTPDRKTVLDAEANLTPTQQDVWRHRHAYIKTPGGYVWNSLEDVRPVLDPKLGALYDAADAGALKLWAARGARSAAPAAAAPGDDPAAELSRKMTLRYDDNGLVGSAAGDFYIRLWGIPFRVSFEIKPHKPDHDNTWIIQLAKDIEVSYDGGTDAGLTEWRRRHGYSLSHGYAWDADFPKSRPELTPDTGRALDDLMAKCAGFWADAAVSIVLNGLDQQLKEAIHWHGAPTVEALTAGDSVPNRRAARAAATVSASQN